MIGPTWKLSPEDVTRTTAILALRRVGKTYTASVIAEEMYDAGVPWVVLDPTGAWWGMRSNASGKGDGLPVVILGGAHGDVPLEETAGKFVAELVLDEPGWYVIDFSLFESISAERRFATDFAVRLYRRKLRAEVKTAMHLFVDEADRFVPQRPPRGEEAMLGAFEALVRRGGITGLGTTLISQRAAVVNKNVLEQIDQLLMLRTTGPNDRHAVDEYLKSTATKEQRAEWAATIAGLPTGVAWRWEPHGDVFEQVKIRERRTFNSSATPKAGVVQVIPSRFAQIDLGAVKEKMAATIERAKADDPVALRKRIKELEREVAHRPKVEPERVVETIERVPDGLAVDVLAQVRRFTTLIEGAARDLPDALEAIFGEDYPAEARKTVAVAAPQPRVAAVPVGPVARDSVPVDGSEDPGKKARQILSALATHGPLERGRLALLVGVTGSGGHFGNLLSRLRTLGYANGSSTLAITAAGEAWADPTPLPSPGVELLDWWCSQKQVGGRAADMLRALSVAGGEMDRSSLAEAVGIDATGGHYGNLLSRLRTLGLVEGSRDIVLAEDLRG